MKKKYNGIAPYNVIPSFELIHITSSVTNYNAFDCVDPSLTTHLGKKTYKHSQT
jgi:hypothetical protein